jgi:uncharacterized protein YbjT (DUF2867 family)
MDVLVTGGTGRLGRLVVSELSARGHEVRVLSRRAGPPEPAQPGVTRVQGDLATGDGLPRALEGVQAVVDAVNSGRAARQVMADGAGRLVRAAAAAGVQHVVGIGIVGVEAVAPVLPYYRVKLAQEAALTSGPVPWSLLRATQFHHLVGRMAAGLARSPIVLAPAVRLQPVDATEVAAALVDAVEAPPAGRLPDVAGPQVLTLAELTAIWLRAHGTPRRTVSVPIPGGVGRAVRDGALCHPGRAVGRTTFATWAERHVTGRSTAHV